MTKEGFSKPIFWSWILILIKPRQTGGNGIQVGLTHPTSYQADSFWSLSSLILNLKVLGIVKSLGTFFDVILSKFMYVKMVKKAKKYPSSPDKIYRYNIFYFWFFDNRPVAAYSFDFGMVPFKNSLSTHNRQFWRIQSKFWKHLHRENLNSFGAYRQSGSCWNVSAGIFRMTKTRIAVCQLCSTADKVWLKIKSLAKYDYRGCL